MRSDFLQSNGEDDSSPGASGHLHPTDSPFVGEHMDWLPVWKNQEQYPQPGASNTRLAWELLRRNRHFQKDCLLAEETTAKQHALCRQWGLVSFTPFWKSLSGTDLIFSAPNAQSAADELAWVQTTKLLSPNKLLLELDLQKMGRSKSERSRQFQSLRDLVERYTQSEEGAPMSVPPTVWPTKVPRYLRVADALSQLQPVTRQSIGEHLHREGLILREHHFAWTDDEVRAKALIKFAHYEPEGVNEMLDAEFKTQAARRKNLHKKYSREVGALIVRAYGLIYGGGYKLLADMKQKTPTRSGYLPRRYPAHGDGLFENSKLHPKSIKVSWS